MKKYLSLSLLFLGIASLKGMEDGQSQPEEVSQRELKDQLDAAVPCPKIMSERLQSLLTDSARELSDVERKYELLLKMVSQIPALKADYIQFLGTDYTQFGPEPSSNGDELSSPRLKAASLQLSTCQAVIEGCTTALKNEKQQNHNTRNAALGFVGGLFGNALLGRYLE